VYFFQAEGSYGGRNKFRSSGSIFQDNVLTFFKLY